MADKVTLHKKEILAVCLQLLEIDHSNFQVKPQRHEALLDLSFLTKIAGRSIADGILNPMIYDVQNCRGQATTYTLL